MADAVELKDSPKVKQHTDTSLSTSSTIGPFKLKRILSVDDEALHGYPRLAAYISNTPGAAIFRSFSTLDARLLLYRQAEIVCLEHELNHLEQLHGGTKELHYRIGELKDAPAGSSGQLLWEKVIEVEGKMEKYRRCLLEHKLVNDLPRPDNYSVQSLYDFVHKEETGGRWLQHPEDTIWEVWDGKQQQKDLVTLSHNFRNQDSFTRIVTGPILEGFHRLYKRFAKPDTEEGTYIYSDKTIIRIINTLIVVIASLLPTISIIALYFISQPIMRLVFVLIFGTVFAACFSLFTAAGHSEVFLASIALASVQAVFIGTNFNSGCGGN
ncbi:hypothetical protein K490DRAFT_53909 [Saccharata proteae CBS 121410]|uniref:DUF6594 domain-containing protein n=1 Tax=Saccharata proteae CBS 121410 TaxID=1314787 RepID=A0A9P4LZE5_9PEZI|nr:hypothetical protein K490DRAFT_53909 [Saccharata proteae CBS 121410]